MQQVMPDHAGSKRWDSLMHYLGPDTLVKNSAGNPWNSNNSRDRVCDSTWSLHPGQDAGQIRGPAHVGVVGQLAGQGLQSVGNVSP
ncbi:hypothetical protein ABT147_38960 [Streptomyces sp. NPDC001868]|uniref:hypothetical protein n=1 Tax=Streptomyces sp. NPDC001868 TaxID=3154401 RepID=UPI00332EE167